MTEIGVKEARDKSGVRVSDGTARVTAVTGHKCACMAHRQVLLSFFPSKPCICVILTKQSKLAAEGASCISQPTACICISIHTYAGSLKAGMFVCDGQHDHQPV